MGLIGKRRGKVAKGVGQPAASGSDAIGGSLSKDDHYYIEEAFGMQGTTAPSGDGMEGSGGTTTTYSTPTGNYKAHTFISSGTFVVTKAPTGASYDAEFLVQGGGGGSKTEGSGNRNAGSGAGGLIYGPAGSLSIASYSITVGAGGNEANGANSVLMIGGPTGQTALGGGMGGANDSAPNCVGAPGGCGGGGWWASPGAHGSATQPGSPPGLSGITNLGYDGSPGNGSPEYGGAGGGTGGVAPGQGTNKGPGTPNVYRFGPTNAQTYGAGGSASDYPDTNRNANGTSNSGDGASGYGQGGSGIVIIRYKT